MHSQPACADPGSPAYEATIRAGLTTGIIPLTESCQHGSCTFCRAKAAYRIPVLNHGQEITNMSMWQCSRPSCTEPVQEISIRTAVGLIIGNLAEYSCDPLQKPS